ncbi:hypothetical protein BJ875DRAFT_73527 [Amylocarpus encephaloides]|uniref:SMP-30/Gluconolactonase/LRE-like region domain-containing protein n=1 Tax=Amylocarpus encephaloides TaxID=45428 RepID=A0A9P7YF85_9HELO|nr:hypothetical protein BJ875DRAFT_73527 [Amylocarpus encephaloides]
MRFLLPLLALPAALPSPVTPREVTNPAIRKVYTFGINRFTENMAVRCNSRLLLTSMSVPTLFQVNPLLASPDASILYTFPNASGLMGITETTTDDVFALTTGTWDLANTRAEFGSLNIYTIDLRPSTPTVKHIANILNSTIFNGITSVPGNRKLILAADSALGAVWKVNLSTGAYDIAFSDPLFAPISQNQGQNLGINGLLAKGSYLYFTNSAQGLYGRVPISSSGAKNGPVQILSNPTMGIVFDDFPIDGSGNAWIASHPSQVVKVRNGGAQKVLTNATALLNPTSARFGRGSARQLRTLYITNGGEFTADFDLINSGVVSFDTAGF